MKKLSILATIAVFLGFLIIPAWAGDPAPPRAGKWAWTESASCIENNAGFNTTYFFSLGSPTWITSWSSQGVAIVHPDGTGTAQGSLVATLGPEPPITTSFAQSMDVSFKFTSSIAADGTITTSMVPGTFTGTILTGPLAGVTFTQTPWSPLSGRASNNGKTETLTAAAPVVETITLSNGSVVYHICNRSQVHIWLGE